jgi:hypothetical protein
MDYSWDDSDYELGYGAEDTLTAEDLQAELCVGVATRLDLALQEADGTCAPYNIDATPDLVVLPGDEVVMEVTLPVDAGGAVRICAPLCPVNVTV